MAGFIRLFSVQSRIKFWCSLIENLSETRHMLIAQNVGSNPKNSPMTIYSLIKDKTQIRHRTKAENGSPSLQPSLRCHTLLFLLTRPLRLIFCHDTI